MNSQATLPAVWTQRYEVLRQCAQQADPILASRPLGWILLARQGMAGWMRRWNEATQPPPTPAAVSGQGPGLPACVWQTQLTTLLAQMTAAHLPTVAAP